MSDSAPTKEAGPSSALRDVAGFVLAGGRSSRMGTDKALVSLGGKPLISYAVAKLRRVAATVSILTGPPPGNPGLAEFAPLVVDEHPGCGPVGGIEAALASSSHVWNLIVPVDVPFLPAELLLWWVATTTADPRSPVRIAFFRADGVLHPTVLLVHRDAAPGLSEAIRRGEYKLLRALEHAARTISTGLGATDGISPALQIKDLPGPALSCSTGSHPASAFGLELSVELPPPSLWFANVNTTQDLAEAERHCPAFSTG